MSYDSKTIRRKTLTSLVQIKHYIQKGLINPKSLDSKINMENHDVERLFQIKTLIDIGFTLDNIKIILDNIKKENLLKVFDHHFKIRKQKFDLFLKKFDDYKLNGLIDISNRDAFNYFKSEITAKDQADKLYELRYEWYKDINTKIKLRIIRKEMYKSFIEHKNYEETYLKIAIPFEELYLHLNENELNESMLYFIAWVKWLTNEQRYIKELKRIAKFNYSIEIFNMALKWIIEKTN